VQNQGERVSRFRGKGKGKMINFCKKERRGHREIVGGGSWQADRSWLALEHLEKKRKGTREEPHRQGVTRGQERGENLPSCAVRGNQKREGKKERETAAKKKGRRFFEFERKGRVGREIGLLLTGREKKRKDQQALRKKYR